MNDIGFIEIGNSDMQEIPEYLDALSSLADESAKDESVLARLGSNPHGELSAKGIDIPEEIGLNVVSNTTDTFYLVLPPDPNSNLADEDLIAVSGGSTASSYGCLACFPSCVGSVSSAGSAG